MYRERERWNHTFNPSWCTRDDLSAPYNTGCEAPRSERAVLRGARVPSMRRCRWGWLSSISWVVGQHPPLNKTNKQHHPAHPAVSQDPGIIDLKHPPCRNHLCPVLSSRHLPFFLAALIKVSKPFITAGFRSSKYWATRPRKRRCSARVQDIFDELKVLLFHLEVWGILCTIYSSIDWVYSRTFNIVHVGSLSTLFEKVEHSWTKPWNIPSHWPQSASPFGSHLLDPHCSRGTRNTKKTHTGVLEKKNSTSNSKIYGWVLDLLAGYWTCWLGVGSVGWVILLSVFRFQRTSSKLWVFITYSPHLSHGPSPRWAEWDHCCQWRSRPWGCEDKQ